MKKIFCLFVCVLFSVISTNSYSMQSSSVIFGWTPEQLYKANDPQTEISKEETFSKYLEKINVKINSILENFHLTFQTQKVIQLIISIKNLTEILEKEFCKTDNQEIEDLKSFLSKINSYENFAFIENLKKLKKLIDAILGE